MAKKVKNPRVARTRNGNTMTESQFWSWMRSSLRRMSMYWKPITIAKHKARKQVVGKRHKFEYQCANCNHWFLDKEVEVDHVIEAGSLRSFSDLSGFAERLFTENTNDLVVLCKPCHKAKTHK